MAKKSAKIDVARRICNLVPSRGVERDWTFEDAVQSAALGAVAALPAGEPALLGGEGVPGAAGGIEQGGGAPRRAVREETLTQVEPE